MDIIPAPWRSSSRTTFLRLGLNDVICDDFELESTSSMFGMVLDVARCPFCVVFCCGSSCLTI